MTVNELIDALTALPWEQRGLDVWTEGCDCLGTVGDVGFDGDGAVILYRPKAEQR